MPGKLEIKNSSTSQDVIVFLWSADGKEQHLNSESLGSGETTGAVVKGGVKKLIVATSDGNVFWEGMVPSYGSSPITIYPEPRGVVTYRDVVLVNTIGYSSQKPFWMTGSSQIWIAVIMFVIIAAIAWYAYKRK